MVNDFDLPALRKSLDAIRRQHGARSSVGVLCSNLIGQLQNWQKYGEADRKRLEPFITRSVEALAKLAAINADDGKTP